MDDWQFSLTHDILTIPLVISYVPVTNKLLWKSKLKSKIKCKEMVLQKHFHVTSDAGENLLHEFFFSLPPTEPKSSGLTGPLVGAAGSGGGGRFSSRSASITFLYLCPEQGYR